MIHYAVEAGATSSLRAGFQRWISIGPFWLALTCQRGVPGVT